MEYAMIGYIPKYVYTLKTIRKPQGLKEDPSKWISGPDPIDHDKYYAYSKHKSQAKFRNEDYELTWDDWISIWPHHIWLQRGRGSDDLCLSRLDFSEGWTMDNLEVIPRLTHLKKPSPKRPRSPKQ